VAWVQVAADAMTASLVFVLASRVAPRRSADAAAAIYAFHPGAIGASAAILTETLFTSLLLTAAAIVVHRADKPTRLWSLVAGVLLGIAALFRPIGLAYVLVFAGIIGIVRRSDGLPGRVARSRIAALVLAVGAVAVIAPWAWRSSVLAGRFVPIQAASPVLLYLPTRTDWNQRDQAALWPAFANNDPYGRLFTRATTPREMIAADILGRRLALENIRLHPAEYVRSRMKTLPFLLFTSFDAFTGRSASFGRVLAEHDWTALATKLVLMTVFCVLPFLLAIIGAVTRPHTMTSALATALWVSTLLIHVPMWIEPRFWLPAVPFVMVTAAHAGARWTTADRSRRAL